MSKNPFLGLGLSGSFTSFARSSGGGGGGGGPSIITEGLTLNLDASNYSGSGDWLDQSGNGYNVTLNGPTYSSDDGGHFRFDGINDVGTFNAGAAFGFLLNPFTFAMWADTFHDGGWAWYFVNKTSGGSIRTMIGAAGNNEKFHFDGTSDIANNPVLPVGQFSGWKHYVCVREGTGSGQFKLYINGALIGSITNNKSYTTDGTSGYIGANDTSEPINAKIATFRTYNNKALTAEEVLQNYNAQKSRFGL